MDVQDFIKNVLRQTEDQLAVRLKEVVENRQYAAAAQLASVSEEVRAMVHSVESAAQPPDPREMRPSGDTESAAPRLAKAPVPTGPYPGRPERRASGRYPRFVRSEGRLVKVGWSKRDQAEYEHRASEASVRAVVAAVRELESREFSMEELMPVYGRSGVEVPSYQVYLIVAWLRKIGAVQRAGRGGYVTVPEGLSTAAMEQHWRTLDSDAKSKGGTSNE